MESKVKEDEKEKLVLNTQIDSLNDNMETLQTKYNSIIDKHNKEKEEYIIELSDTREQFRLISNENKELKHANEVVVKLLECSDQAREAKLSDDEVTVDSHVPKFTVVKNKKNENVTIINETDDDSNDNNKYDNDYTQVKSKQRNKTNLSFAKK